MGKVFDLGRFIDLEGFEKIGYLTGIIGLSEKELAQILEIDESILNNTIYKNIFVKNSEEWSRIYNFFILLNYLLICSSYEGSALQKMWIEKNHSFYDPCAIKPPWYELGLDNYLKNSRYIGLKNCLEWTIKH